MTQATVRKVPYLEIPVKHSTQTTTKKSLKQNRQNPRSLKIANVALGFQHTIALAENGQAYGCGKCDFHQIQPYAYHFDKQKVSLDALQNPQLVYGKRRVVKAACGSKHTILNTEDGKFYALGHNKFGQCGLDPEKNPQVWRLTQIFFPYLKGQEVIDIQCGSYHTLILTNFHLYFMGSIKKNQNPFISFKEDVSAPTIVNLPARPIKMYTNFQRTAVITQDGKAYFFGGSNLGYRGGQSSALQIVDSFNFNKDSLIGLGFSHTVIAP